MNARKRSSVACLFAGTIAIFALALTAVSLRAGIPEPDLIWYGKVLTVSSGTTVRVTSGTLTWQIEPLAGGTPWVLSTLLTNINDQFSFVLRVPCETPESGIAATMGTVILTAPAARYRRMTVMLNGQPLSFIGSSGEFAPLPADRGRSERIDLQLGTAPVDSDGNGLADDWERQYFGHIGVDPNADPDGDGMTNLQEYRAGTNPTDAQSRFEVVEINRLPSGVQVRWLSQPNHRYRVRRSNTLLAAPANYQIVQAGLVATPPINEFLDTTTASGAQFFYLIELEE